MNGSIGFFKTHNALYNFKGKYPFTDYNNTLGAIYIVRDPRNVVISYSRHLNLSPEKVTDMLIRAKSYEIDIMGTWKENYLSWKNMTQDKKCLPLKSGFNLAYIHLKFKLMSSEKTVDLIPLP